MIEITNISKTYGNSKVKAVDTISVQVRSGEIFGFLGPNGSGKTTTIKMITGVLNPDSGQILVDGIDIAENPMEAKKRIGYVSDNPELFSQLKAVEYLNFVGDVYGVPTDLRQERVERYASLFEINEVLNSSIGSFSHGMKQKLLITASLLPDPAVWILDEPMVGLDPKSAFQLKEIMREMANAGKSVFFSTHVMEVAEKLCDRLSIISAGKIMFEGTLQELRETRGENSSLEKLFLELVDTDRLSSFGNSDSAFDNENPENDPKKDK
ncbi:ABC transporter ATP-binding protein [Treponema phagedenis]|uniref:ABC transporter ATP-binding protein n=1 Tax=Treponema phagedenis TaxID=162 RepID=A0AAE6IS17_TREPH|nr:ABC transporter ATP-binding protein [Treponema phagedenis]NVP25182.1 ABC transporter ATP-binding protein [Treponema phagedenis]QEJ95959.1 ABC transporter ATP-binding protein [Treponema phagedenis]QEJ97297.1 ABC transporter ATP-binding protein [Treponema phagedenis]QEK00342.1 ABC transporter ATP-binding protein [Treponema phagedenis]QEK02509.1 ABC transporter ATP-binding protein [Treponema phagedenis]